MYLKKNKYLDSILITITYLKVVIGIKNLVLVLLTLAKDTKYITDSMKILIDNREDDERIEMLKREVRTFKDHPALLSWYLADEPDGRKTDPAILNNLYKQGLIVHVVPKRMNRRLLAQQGEFLFPFNIRKPNGKTPHLTAEIPSFRSHPSRCPGAVSAPVPPSRSTTT